MNPRRKRILNARRNRRAFNLVELLMAVVLMSITVAGMTRMWSVSRNITGQSQVSGEVYDVARQEVERDKNLMFDTLFIANGVSVSKVTDYDQMGHPLATNLTNALGITVSGVLTLTAAPTANAYYRAVSSYSLVSTGTETDPGSLLGIQTVTIYPVNGGTVVTTAPGIYQTTEFYSAAGL